MESTARIVDAIGRDRWVVTRDFIEGELVARLRAECGSEALRGRFQAAAIGGGERRQIRSDVRADEILWWHESELTAARRECLARFEQLRLALNQALQLGLWEFECHYASYRPGTFYRRHLDQLMGDGRRRVSCILYLNEGWQSEDGGALRIYRDKTEASAFDDVLPAGGALVVFPSERFFHEVLPAGRERLSLTGWFRTR